MPTARYTAAAAPRRHATRTSALLAALAILALALVVRAGMLDRAPEFDELYHLLAARGWLETGGPTILDGEYVRTAWFTRVVAWVFALTGSTALETGRLVPLVAGILVPPVLFLWLHARAGWPAALIGGALAVLWPQGIEEAQTLRFYSWQVLAFLAGAIAAYEAIERREWTARAAWTLFALASLGIALYLQINTAIGIAAILAWIGLAVLLPAIWSHRWRWWVLAGLALAGLLALALAVASGLLAELWAFYRWAPGWIAHEADNPVFYHFQLLRIYPVLWPLFPLAALLAFRAQPRLAAYCCVLFGTIFLGQSFGGMKSMRYLSFGMPFFFAVLGIAAAAVLPAVTAALLAAADAANPTRWRWVSSGLVLAAALFLALANPFVETSLKSPFGKGAFGRPQADWSQMPELLGAWREVPFRMTTRELQTIDVLGDYDVMIGQNRLSEFDEPGEFQIDLRTGRPVVAGNEAISEILRCRPEGVLLAERDWWENEGRGLDLLPLFEAAGRTVEIRQDQRLFALRWTGGPAAPAACAALPLGPAA